MRSPDLDGRHSGLKKAAAALVPMMIHEPELHGRHGGLKAWAGDPRGPEARDGWPSWRPSKRRCLSMRSRSPVLGGRHCGPKAAAASVCGRSHTGWPPWRPEGRGGMCSSFSVVWQRSTKTVYSILWVQPFLSGMTGTTAHGALMQ